MARRVRITTEGYYPIFTNKIIKKIWEDKARINGAISWVSKAYDINGIEIIYDEVAVLNTEVKNALLLLTRRDNLDVITRFIDNFEKLVKIYPPKTIVNMKTNK